MRQSLFCQNKANEKHRQYCEYPHFESERKSTWSYNPYTSCLLKLLIFYTTVVTRYGNTMILHVNNIKSKCNNCSKFKTYTGNRKQIKYYEQDYRKTCTYYYDRSYCWHWHQCWCLSYIQVKTSYQEFSKNYQEQNQLFL